MRAAEIQIIAEKVHYFLSQSLRQADVEFNNLHEVWQDDALTTREKLKKKLYEGLLQIVLYGCEAWMLTVRVKQVLNGWNSVQCSSGGCLPA